MVDAHMRRLPAFADRCCERNDTVKACREKAGMTLESYVGAEAEKTVTNNRIKPLMDPSDLCARAGEYAAELLGAEAGRDVERAMHFGAACTADHHGGLYSAQMLHGDILFGILLEKLGYTGRHVPILSPGQVEMDNSTYARGICAYMDRDGKQTFPIYKEKQHSMLVSCAGPMTREMLSRLRLKHIEEVDPADSGAVIAANILSDLLPAAYETEEVLSAARFSDQATLIGRTLSENMFTGEAPIYTFLEMEELIKPLLLAEIRGEGALIPALLYDTAVRRELMAETMPDGCAIAGDLFRGIDEKGRKIYLMLDEEGYLTGKDKRGGDIRWKADPDTLSDLIVRGKILPAGFLLAVLTFFERGLTWYGGIFQSLYLPVWRDYFARAIRRGGLTAEADTIERYICSGHISGPVFALYRGDGFAAPAGPVELWAAKPSFDRIRELVSRTGVWDGHLMAMPEIYFDLTKRDERAPNWYRTITTDLYTMFPNNAMTRDQRTVPECAG